MASRTYQRCRKLEMDYRPERLGATHENGVPPGPTTTSDDWHEGQSIRLLLRARHPYGEEPPVGLLKGSLVAAHHHHRSLSSRKNERLVRLRP